MATVPRVALGLLTGIAIFVGLPLVGWGVVDAQGFVANAARLCYIVLALLLQVISMIMIPGLGRSRGKGKKTVRRSQVGLVLLQVITLAIVIVAPYCDRRGILTISQVQMVRYLGLVMFTLGFLAMHWAESVLGRLFSVEVTIQEDHSLVTAGPYRYLRHPRYLGIIVSFAGISLVYLSWIALILVAGLKLVLIWRIRDEEALMHQEFGTDWEAYTKRSWRLIPFVY
jgi:protein-S-isoprenylcysteine O-methyltransferase Ste14